MEDPRRLRLSKHFMLSDFGEVWKPINGYSGKYEVSTAGRVRRVGQGKNSHVLYLMTGWIDDQGRLKVTLRKNTAAKQFTVSTLVAASFLGPRPAGLDVLHRDGNPAKSELSNLYYGTKAQNMADKRLHGTQPQGESSHLAKLTESAVLAIRKALNNRQCTQTDLATFYGVSNQTITDIKKRVSWGHI